MYSVLQLQERSAGYQDPWDPQNFGKDMGLVHEAVVSGRKIGFGKEHWAVLAHNSGIFQAVRDLLNSTSTAEAINAAAAFDKLRRAHEKVNNNRSDSFGDFMDAIGTMTALKAFDTSKQTVSDAVGGLVRLDGDVLHMMSEEFHCSCCLGSPSRMREKLVLFMQYYNARKVAIHVTKPRNSGQKVKALTLEEERTAQMSCEVYATLDGIDMEWQFPEKEKDA